ANFRLDVDGAAKLFNVGFHHVHADAATGGVGDNGGGGEARLEDEEADFLIRHAHQLAFVNHTAFKGDFLDLHDIHAVAIIGDGDDDVVALVHGGQLNITGFRFATLNPGFWRFDTVINRVANQVDQGVADCLNHRFINFGVAADNAQINKLL